MLSLLTAFLSEMIPNAQLTNNKIEGKRQDETKATYWEGRKPKDGELSEKMMMDEVDRLVRATPPIARTIAKQVVPESFSFNINQEKKATAAGIVLVIIPALTAVVYPTPNSIKMENKKIPKKP